MLQKEGLNRAGVGGELLSTMFVEETGRPVLSRYASMVGHQEPLSFSEAARFIASFTGSPLERINKRLSGFRGAFSLEGQVPADLTMFILERHVGNVELEGRFGWRNIDLPQTATVASAMSRRPLAPVFQEIQREILSTYPSVAPVLQEHAVAVPPSFLLQRIDTWLSADERKSMENGISRFSLTPTQFAVLLHVAASLPNEEICALTEMSYDTLKNHIASILAALSEGAVETVCDRTQATIIALKEGLFPRSLAMRISEMALVPKLDDLSPRQKEVLVLLAQGFSAKEIASKLGISLPTIKNHKTEIFKKLECTNQTAAVLVFYLERLEGLPISPLSRPQTLPQSSGTEIS